MTNPDPIADNDIEDSAARFALRDVPWKEQPTAPPRDVQEDHFAAAARRHTQALPELEGQLRPRR